MMIRALFALIAASIAVAVVFTGGWLTQAIMPGLVHVHLGAQAGWVIAMMCGLMGGFFPVFIAYQQEKRREPEPPMTPKIRNGQIG